MSDMMIIDEFIDSPEKTEKYCYMLIYTERKQLLKNFGSGYEKIPLPMAVHREYDEENDDYIMKLSDPQATTIKKKKLNLLTDDKIEWEVIYDRNASKKE